MAETFVSEFKPLEEIFDIVEVSIASMAVMLNLATIGILLASTGRLNMRLRLLLSLLICDLLLAVLHIIRPYFYFDSIWFTDSLDYDVSVNQMNAYLEQTFDLKDFLQIMCSDVYFTAQIAGLTVMLALAFDILILVKYPLQYEDMTSQRKTNIVLASIWSGSIVIVVVFRVIVELDWFGVIDVTWSSYPLKGYVHFVYGGFQAISNVCFLVFIIVYLVIYFEIRKFVARTPSAESRDTVKAAVTMAVILTTYLICLMPASWVVLTGVITRNSELFRKLIVISRSLYVSNAVCDPIIYAIRIPDVRQRYRQFFCRKVPTGSSETAITSVRSTD